MTARLACAAAWLAAFATTAAFAAPVELRPEPASHGATITLGDLFEGAGKAAETVVGEAAPAGGEAVLDAARVQTVLGRVGLQWSNASGRRRIVVTAQAGAPPTLRTARAAHASAALVYARSLATGDVVAASDLVWSAEAVAPGDAPRDADEVVGKAARRPVREGMAVGVHDLASPHVIRRDDLVQVAFEEDGVRLVLEGKALGDAAVGEPVQVVNVQSKKVLDAVAAAPGLAVVGARAETLRGAFDPSLRLASR